jgi:hypothetical protein
MLKKIESLHIDGRRWFQRSAGNTYHSVTVFVNGETLRAPYSYGYGDQFLQTAGELLAAAGYDVKTNRPGCLGTRHLREELGGTYSVSDVSRKKDM